MTQDPYYWHYRCPADAQIRNRSKVTPLAVRIEKLRADRMLEMCQHEGMSSVRIPPEEPVDEDTLAILDQRLKTIDDDAKSARPWREVMAESQAKLKHPAPQ